VILECNQCKTRFLVDNDLLRPDGRTVRCASCGNTWHADPPTEKEIKKEEAKEAAADAGPSLESKPAEDMQTEALDVASAQDEPAPVQVDSLPNFDGISEEEAGVPNFQAPALAPEDDISGSGMWKLACVVLIIAVIVTGLFTFRDILAPSLQPVYDVLGMSNTDGLVLADVEARQRASRTHARFVIEGLIVNQSDEPRQVPVLRAAIVDANGEVLISREYEADNTILQPGDAYPFKASKLDTAFTDRVAELVLDLGNGVQLMLRP
tara:strand:+ start:800 stop:1597 length:798 start_codon:yes stop_codon:yes gene_type:complete